MQISWFTDIHLNFLDKKQREIFYSEIIATKAQAVLISGDIAEADCVCNFLIEMESTVHLPIYFVLGNHDFYGSNVASVIYDVLKLIQSCSNLIWLTETSPHNLTKDILLVGVDGWADGRYGDFRHSHVALNDSLMIADLFQAKLLNRQQLLAQMQLLADKDARRLKQQLTIAVKQKPMQIIILTHVPPFAEACVYENKQSTDDYLPFFSSKIIGDVLINSAQTNPEIEFLVLCGHTHEAAFYKASKNLTVKVGGAKYNKPKLAEVVELYKSRL